MLLRSPTDDEPLRLVETEEGDRWMVTGIRPLELIPELVEDEGRRIVLMEERGDDVFGRVMTGELRVLLVAEDLGVLGRRVTMVGDERVERELLLDDGLYDRVGVERVTRAGALLADEDDERRGVEIERDRLIDEERERLDERYVGLEYEREDERLDREMEGDRDRETDDERAGRAERYERDWPIDDDERRRDTGERPSTFSTKPRSVITSTPPRAMHIKSLSTPR